MNESKIAVRYAKALFLTALDKDILEPVHKDILLIDSIIYQIDNFQIFLSSPVNKPSVKIKFIKQVFAEGLIHEITLSFLNLVVQNNRAAYIPGITRYFIHLYRKHKGIQSAEFVLAAESDEKLNERILKVLKELFKSEIDLQVSVDKSLIGGFILRVEDQQYDASIATALNKMKSKLLQRN
jgi:F-type H+-transporting ATPase subunit delta